MRSLLPLRAHGAGGGRLRRAAAVDETRGKPEPQGAVCPVPLRHQRTIMLGHGSGGQMTHELIARVFYPPLENPELLRGDDAAVVAPPQGGRLALSTDSHVVNPLIFPGGDIGRLAVCGTVNDLAAMGARPLWLTAGFVLEEGLALETLEVVLTSMQRAAAEAGVRVVAGDTKVVERGRADGMYLTTSGVGWIPPGRSPGGAGARAGDAVIVSGPVGDHGIAVLAARGGLQFEAEVESDCAPLGGLVESLFEAGVEVHVLRDPTRGGLGTTLNEIARQSGVGIVLEETAVPVRPAVQAACELLGFDALHVACEGRMVVIAPGGQAEAALRALRAAPHGAKACVIGAVVAAPAGRVLMRTRIGATRVVEMLAGEMLPRIC